MDRRSLGLALLGAALLALASCRLPEVGRSEPELPELWRAPERALAPGRLRLEPAHAVARLGESVQLRIEGELAAQARCVMEDGEAESPPLLLVSSPETPGPVDVLCGADGVRAAAQVTFTDAQTLPIADPYAGGIALFKLSRAPAQREPIGTRALGHPDLDVKLARFSAWALPAFPFADPGARDRSGIGNWVAVEVPRGVNYYQAIDWIRRDPAVIAASYLPLDAEWLGVDARSDWPSGLGSASARASTAAIPAVQPAWTAPGPDPLQATRDLRIVGAASVWPAHTGRGVRIAIVDTGLDINHAAIAPNLLLKELERPDRDADGNGIPGDASGVNLAHLALAHGSGPPRLALGLVSDISDWHGALDDEEHWGHGTAIASLAAGAGGPGARLGVAPRAQLLAVDVEENLRLSESLLLQDDPRLRLREAGGPPLRSSVWSRAAGIVYAVTSGARVLTCAWSEDTPHLLLHDVLEYAEDNCALAVCAVDAPPGPLESFPAHWRSAWLDRVEGGSGSALDLWSGEVLEDFFARPLRATLVAGALEARGEPTPEADEVAPDLFAPTGGWRGRGGVAAAVSNPRNDHMPVPDYHAAPFRGPAAAAGLIAGAAALVSELRPDLDPAAVASALRAGTREVSGHPLLDVPGALRAAQQLEAGSCAQAREPDGVVPTLAQQPRASWWRRLGLGKYSEPARADPLPPASPEPAP